MMINNIIFNKKKLRLCGDYVTRYDYEDEKKKKSFT